MMNTHSRNILLCCPLQSYAVLCSAVLSMLCCCPHAVLLPSCCAVPCCVTLCSPVVHAGKELENELPPHAYTNNYAPDFRLHIPVRTGKENLNTPEHIARLRDELLQNISRSASKWHASFLSDCAPDLQLNRLVQGCVETTVLQLDLVLTSRACECM